MTRATRFSAAAGPRAPKSKRAAVKPAEIASIGAGIEAIPNLSCHGPLNNRLGLGGYPLSAARGRCHQSSRFQRCRGHGPEASQVALKLPSISVIIGLEPVPVAFHGRAFDHARMALALERLKPVCTLVPLGHGDEVTRHKLRLVVGKPPDGAVGLDEADSE